jgi:hypothetical protein
MNIKHSPITFLVVFITAFGFAQPGEIKLEFMGNCGLHLTDGKSNIYIDFPYETGAYNYMKYDASVLNSIKENSIFIFTHKHADHYSRKILRKVLKEKNGQKYGVYNIKALKNIETTIDDFEIEAFKTKHTVFRIPFRHFSYLITWHGKKIFISGDASEPETICCITNIDWAFAPYWILKNAKSKGLNIDANMVFVYHLYSDQFSSAKEHWGKTENIHPLTELGETQIMKY